MRLTQHWPLGHQHIVRSQLLSYVHISQELRPHTDWPQCMTWPHKGNSLLASRRIRRTFPISDEEIEICKTESHTPFSTNGYRNHAYDNPQNIGKSFTVLRIETILYRITARGAKAKSWIELQYIEQSTAYRKHFHCLSHQNAIESNYSNILNRTPIHCVISCVSWEYNEFR